MEAIDLKTEEEYEAALAEIEGLMDVEDEEDPRFHRLLELVDQVVRYENIHYPME